MGLTKERIIEGFINPALREVLPPEMAGSIGAADLELLGKGAVLDSLGFVGFILAIEGSLQETLNMTLTLASEDAFSRSASPFRTVGTLAEYIAEFTAGAQGG
jgi:acyl carrier protein